MIAGHNKQPIPTEPRSIKQVIEKFRSNSILFCIAITGNITGCKNQVWRMHRPFFPEPLDRRDKRSKDNLLIIRPFITQMKIRNMQPGKSHVIELNG